jgi:hypothetical protein
MSRSLGSLLPDGLIARLSASPEEDAPAEQAVVLTSVDPYGWPHPALLSEAEVVALDASRLRLALGATSRSARHLRDSGRATLVFAGAAGTIYVKAEAVALPPAPDHPELARFELVVQDVLEDQAGGDEAGARLRQGLVIEWPPGVDRASRRRWLRNVLRD